MTQAFIQAGIPSEAIAIYPGLGDIGAPCCSTARAA